MAAIRHRAVVLHETNPMLGHRGCRLGITYPEIYEMQAAAIFKAAVAVAKETREAVAWIRSWPGAALGAGTSASWVAPSLRSWRICFTRAFISSR